VDPNHSLDALIHLIPTSSTSPKVPFPSPCTLRAALTNYLDLNASIKQYQLMILAKYATHTLERNLLFECCENRDTFIEVFGNPSGKTVVDVLEDFKSIKVTISHLFFFLRFIWLHLIMNFSFCLLMIYFPIRFHS